MAMRENTGLQVALILFVMITVVLAVTTYMYFSSATEARTAEKAANNLVAQRDASIKELNAEIESLRGLMGYKHNGGPTVGEIESNFQADMAKFGEGYKTTRDYRLLPQYQFATIDNLNKQLDQAKLDMQDLETQLAAAREQAVRNLAARDTEYTEGVAIYNAHKATLDDQRAKEVARVEGIAEAFNKASQQVSSIKAESNNTIDELTQKVGALDRLNDVLTDKLDNIQHPDAVGKAEKPDGRVTWVSQRGGTVYINLGSDDGLRRSTLFTVYDAGAVNLAQTDAKASIEVTTIRGPHLAEARIIEDTLSNPILSQDNIYSPVWDPGQKTHFALAGFMDVDNDRKSDRELIRGLVARNGGVVDAEVLDDGTREGRLSIKTRYLVVGESPNEKTNPIVRDAYSTMYTEAKDMGIEIITVERLLSDMGWRGNIRTVGAGSNPSGGDFQAVPKESSGGASSGFQPRTRPGTATRRERDY